MYIANLVVVVVVVAAVVVFFLVVHVPCSGPCGYRPIVDGVNGEVPQSVKNCECNVQCVLGKEEHQMGQ